MRRSPPLDVRLHGVNFEKWAIAVVGMAVILAGQWFAGCYYTGNRHDVHAVGFRIAWDCFRSRRLGVIRGLHGVCFRKKADCVGKLFESFARQGFAGIDCEQRTRESAGRSWGRFV
ncbi:hypothetical protein [Chromobacterium sphagni]|uniref:hypothetical protein n=1 Tax=Chromobacterium sphagni TaxID=1903179 RepID=UPI0019D371CF|nr:hypothetical protein [Chromobacterium sphagni]